MNRATGPPADRADPASGQGSRASPVGLDPDSARVLRELAAVHQALMPAARARGALAKLGFTERRFRAIFASIGRHVAASARGTHAEEWLLDNRHAIQDALQQVRENLPRRFLRILPAVATDSGAPEPRVLCLARTLLRLGTRPIDLAWVARALDWYQLHTPLGIGELWALPSFLRLVALDALAEDGSHFAEGAAEGAADADAAGRVAGAIVSLRQIAQQDWLSFFEQVSRVERVLGRDPAGAYAHMDFASRDQYRRAVEQLARDSGRGEEEVAEFVVQRCSQEDPVDIRRRHVGHLLTREGRTALERELGCRIALSRRLFRRLMGAPAVVYFGLLAGFSVPPLAALAWLLARFGHAWSGILPLLALVAIPVLGLSVAMLNGLVVWLLPPRRLPKLDFEAGVPAGFRTAVVVPVLFGSPEDIDQVFARLEVNALGNDDRNLVYVVLSDFTDAGSRTAGGDEALIARAAERIDGMNRAHASGEVESRFLLLHRERRWNPAEGCWMGWERKRGKLAEFNALLGGHGDTGFETRLGPQEALAGVRLVITLDADTHMPPGTARKMVGALAHPLNRPLPDAGGRGLAAGFCILQPRLNIDPESSHVTRFTAIYSGDTTLDLYTHAVSDVYFDLFGEGIYAGKGAYDWQAFEAALRDRVPENSLLSHDLLEGVHARVALASDVVLLEQYPPNVLAYLRREHRWVRGDWQLLPWLLPRSPSAGGGTQRNPLPLIHRWKILDNMRRSLQPPAVLALLVVGWLGVLPGPAWAWTLLFAGLLASPLISEVFNQVGRGLGSPGTLPERIRRAPGLLRQRLEHWLLVLTLLPYESQVLLDAILRTLFRLLVSRRHLLEWTSAAHVDRRLGPSPGLAATWQEMWGSPLLALVLAIVLHARGGVALVAAAPLLLAWLLAPQIAWWVSRPLHVKRDVPRSRDIRLLRGIARRTWLFFSRFVGPDDHWLPPDNYQEQPRAALARRTSPTNIGMALLSTLSAHDLGYLDHLTLAARLRNTLDRMGRLEQFRGHLLNWYETRDLRPLSPRYVSTVDSGNLAASLLTLARGLEELRRQPASGQRLLLGIGDTLGVIEDTLESTARLSSGRPFAPFLADVRRLRRRLEGGGGELWQVLLQLHERDVPALRERLLQIVEAGEMELGLEELGRLRVWVDELRHQTQCARRQMDELCGWQPLLAEPPGACRRPFLDHRIEGLLVRLEGTLEQPAPLTELADRCAAAEVILDELMTVVAGSVGEREALAQAKAWGESLRQSFTSARTHAEALLRALQDLAEVADRWVARMDFGFLYDPKRHLFHLGFDVSSGVMDANHYDLIASEARLASFLAIAKGDVPVKHWMHLSRPFRRRGGEAVLMSWSGTLFEYLMPRLMLATPEDTLMHRASRHAVAAHRAFGRRFRRPWGISESGYYHFDAQQHYQYRAFGAPGLGFSRNLGDRVVVAPYASLLALPFEATAVIANLRRLSSLDMLGPYGLYEAVDFGRPEKAAHSRARIVASYMSHHQGMGLVAINNFLNGDAMRRRFHADPRVAGVALLLHEQLPRGTAVLREWDRPQRVHRFQGAPRLHDWAASPGASAPQLLALSNGHYSVLLADDGSSGSRWEGIDLTRWDPDVPATEGGQGTYVKDLDDGRLFSIGLAPVGGNEQHCRVRFGPHAAEFQRRELGLLCQMGIAVSAQHDVEARRVLVRNETALPRRLLLAACAEVSLASPGDDARHPAFSKLFIECSYVASDSLLLFRRRPRHGGEEPLYFGHTLMVDGADTRFRWESDRARVLGRQGRADRPALLSGGLEGFGDTTGATLDPALATGVEFHLPPHGQVEVIYLSGVGRGRPELLAMLRSYRSKARVDWIFEQSRMQSEQELHLLGIAPAEVAWMSRLLSLVLQPRGGSPSGALARRDAHDLRSALWARGISGDLPILLAIIRSAADLGFAESVIRAHTLWCGRQQPIDLVLIDDASDGYAQPLRDRLRELIEEARARIHRKLAGSAFIVAGRELPETERSRLLAAARWVLDAVSGSPESQLEASRPPPLPPFVPVLSSPRTQEETPRLQRPEGLLQDNGLGGFSADGREYVIHLDPGTSTPAPWSNVIANPGFGCLLSESGGACTWAGNSGENRLTPWHNDALQDRSGEALYLRDEETAEVWSPTAQPMPSGAAYQARHGAGYSEFRHHSHGLVQHYRVWVDDAAPVKIGRLHLRNLWRRPRRITVTCYAEWVLGVTRAGSVAHLVCEFDAGSQALLARNAFRGADGSPVAFLAASQPPHGLTTDRQEFLGRGGSMRAPAALFRIGLSGAVNPQDDPCAVYQVHVDLPPGASADVHFVLGQGRDRAEALELAQRFRDVDAVEASHDRVMRMWEALLGNIEVEMPEAPANVMLNRWLLYQTLACRLWGRTGYYQSSGAFGFRDQLQDAMALTWSAPNLVRQQILRAAACQFEEGDVLHWWHEAPLRGVRTRCSDDLLWLPYVVAHYVGATGDASLLDEAVPYLSGPLLERDEAERYFEFSAGAAVGSIFDHCCRAIERASSLGAHGLPLMGSGDWNDGMNRVGIGGRGESVWLGWFLIRVCRDFAPLCGRRGESERASALHALADRLRVNIDAHAWDGQWYRRAWYDDGTPLGSSDSDECRIDLLAQAWSVLADDAPSERSLLAMDALRGRLVDAEARLILLLAPPFDRTAHDPGYIKGYPPGIRENGGQYSHAAVWAAWAAAACGDREGAMGLFRLLNPVLRSATPADAARYRIEPYVMAGDIYGVAPHRGRGGWSWYTGAAGWMYRLGIEALLGLRLRGDALEIRPCIPPSWPGCRVRLRRGRSLYRISMRNLPVIGSAADQQPVDRRVQVSVALDGEAIVGCVIPFVDDGNEHEVEVALESLPGQ